MLNLVSLLIGLLGLLLAFPAFLPFLGALNWLFLPIPLFGLAVGALSRGTAGRNLNIVVTVIMVLRLMLGHGIFEDVLVTSRSP